jgi:hypothetical protein
MIKIPYNTYRSKRRHYSRWDRKGFISWRKRKGSGSVSRDVRIFQNRGVHA